MRHKIFRFFSACLMLAMLPGCASSYGVQNTPVNYYPACYYPIQDLREREHDVTKGTAGGALIGALGGALLGLLATGGKWEGAAVGGATGGVAGTMMGNAYATRQHELDDNRRLARYLQDIDGDISNLDVVGAAAKSSLQCYDKNFQVLLTEIRARKITREAAQQRFAEISAGREEAIALLGDAVNHGENLSRQYEQAFMYEQQQLQAPVNRSQGTASNARKSNAIQAGKTRSKALTHKTDALRAEKNSAQNATSTQLAQFREELNNINL